MSENVGVRRRGGPFLVKNRHETFEILWCTTFMQNIKKILRAVLEKNWSLLLTTHYGSDLVGTFLTKGRGSKSDIGALITKMYNTIRLDISSIFLGKSL